MDKTVLLVYRGYQPFVCSIFRLATDYEVVEVLMMTSLGC